MGRIILRLLLIQLLSLDPLMTWEVEGQFSDNNSTEASRWTEEHEGNLVGSPCCCLLVGGRVTAAMTATAFCV